MIRNGPVSIISMTNLHLSNGKSSTLSTCCIPALLTTTSTDPGSLTTRPQSFLRFLHSKRLLDNFLHFQVSLQPD